MKNQEKKITTSHKAAAKHRRKRDREDLVKKGRLVRESLLLNQTVTMGRNSFYTPRTDRRYTGRSSKRVPDT